MNEMKRNTTIGLRLDQETKDVLAKASALSGIPISEIIRKSAVSEAMTIISMFRNVKHVNTDMSTEGAHS